MQNILPLNYIVLPVTNLSRVFDLTLQKLLKKIREGDIAMICLFHGYVTFSSSGS